MLDIKIADHQVLNIFLLQTLRVSTCTCIYVVSAARICMLLHILRFGVLILMRFFFMEKETQKIRLKCGIQKNISRF